MKEEGNEDLQTTIKEYNPGLETGQSHPNTSDKRGLCGFKIPLTQL